jgi:leader peptidase (prepilin peptidase) / N-methyltransferase
MSILIENNNKIFLSSNFMDIFYSTPWLFPVLTTVFGLILGSFLNVVIYRLPKMMEAGWKEELVEAFPDQDISFEDETSLSLSLPHSFCPHCHTKIQPWHNIPVLSWLLLRGKCHACKQPISLRYPLVELLTAGTSYLIATHFGLTSYTLALLAFSYCLIAASFIDLDTMLLPDGITLPLMWGGIALSMAHISPVSLYDSVLGAMGGYLSLWSLYWMFRILTGKDGMGYGDFKFLAAIGAWLGWQMLPMVVLVSSVIGAVFGITLLIIHRKNFNNSFPFGPYLALASWITLLWHDDILSWYFSSVLGG